MELQVKSKLLRIFAGENNRIGHDLLCEKILFSAEENGLAGATAIKAIMSYGSGSHMRRAKLIELSEDLPVVIEIVDSSEKIDAFLPVVNDLFDQCGKGD